MIRRTFRGLVQLLGALGAGLAILLVLAAWRLSSGPITLAFLSPYIEKALSAEDGSLAIRLDNTILTWAGWERTLDVRVLNVRAVGAGGTAVAVVPELSLSLSVKALVKGVVAPRSIELYRPSLQVARRQDGTLEVGFGQGAEASDVLSSRLLERLSKEPDEVGPLGYLSRITVRDADVLIVDRGLDTVWHAPQAEVSLRRDADGVEGEISLDLENDGRVTRIDLLGGYRRSADRLDFGVRFSDLVPATFARLSPQLAALGAAAVPLSGRLLVSLKMDGGVEAVDFEMKGGAGRIELPAPLAQSVEVAGLALNGLYRGADQVLTVDRLKVDLGEGGSLLMPAADGHRTPLRSLTARATLDEGGDHLEVTSVEADLGGPTATLTADIRRDGGETRIRAEGTLREVPADDAHLYWPAVWGRDAHTWVTANLSAGRIIEALERNAPALASSYGIAPYMDSAGKAKAVNHGYDGWVVLKTPNSAESMKFMKWFTENQYINFLHTAPLHFQPPRLDVYEDARWRAHPLIEKHKDELALLETLDMGKPITFALNVDLGGVVRTVQWYAEAVDKIYDEIAPSDRDALAMITREPLGVVAAVVPWNFPLLMAAWKFAPALAAGNSIIIKPAEQSPLSALRIAELAAEAGIPDGVFNVLPGFGETAGQALGRHMDVDMVAFTGSTEVGKFFLKYSAESNMKHVSLECGGKSPNIVFNDCKNLDAAAQGSGMGVFFNTGQVCVAATRLLVQQDIHDEFIEKVKKIGEIMQPGDPLDPGTLMGSLVDVNQMERVKSYIEIGRKEGAKLAFGGKQVRQNTGGAYVEPTIFDKVDNSMRIAQEEIFGPVLSTITFKDEEEAVRIANDTIYGLQASLWTDDLNRAHRVARKLRAGTVNVNDTDGGDITVPFGGYKQSGIGRDKSLHAYDKYTQIKTTYIKFP